MALLQLLFSGKNLSEVKGLLNNPHVQMVEEDQRRMPTIGL